MIEMEFLFILIIFIPYFFYLEWKDKPKQKIGPFAIFISFIWFTCGLSLIISIMAIGIFSLGVLAVRGENFTSSFFLYLF